MERLLELWPAFSHCTGICLEGQEVLTVCAPIAGLRGGLRRELSSVQAQTSGVLTNVSGLNDTALVSSDRIESKFYHKSSSYLTVNKLHLQIHY